MKYVQIILENVACVICSAIIGLFVMSCFCSCLTTITAEKLHYQSVLGRKTIEITDTTTFTRVE